jgi:predicted dehydrogenase
VAQIGIAHSHAAGRVRAFRENASVEFVGLHEPFPAVRADRGGNPAYAGVAWLSAEEILGDSTLAAVAIETLPGENVRWAREALLAGKHVILEKPPGLLLADLRDLFRIAEARGLYVRVGYIFRTHPAFVLGHRLVAAGAFGRLWRISAQLGSEITDYEAGRDGDVQNYPGGICYTLAGHVLDQIVAFLGPPLRVTTFLRRDHRPADGVPFADNNLAVFEYERALATIETWSLEAGDNFAHRRFEIYGEHGTLLISPIEPPRVRLYLAAPFAEFADGWQDVAVGNWPRYVDDLVDFLACIRGDVEPHYGPSHDLATQEALLRASGAFVD